MKKTCIIICFGILLACLSALSCNASDPSQEGRFVINQDDTVLDTKTGLMWAAKDNEADTNWDEAKSFCENYSAGGHSDWRMPTLDELGTIYDINSSRRFKTVPQISLSACCPWSSDTRRKRARSIFFISGEINTFPKKFSTGFRALPVRNAK